jgi:hypothetical protein
MSNKEKVQSWDNFIRSEGWREWTNMLVKVMEKERKVIKERARPFYNEIFGKKPISKDHLNEFIRWVGKVSIYNFERGIRSWPNG